MLSNNGYVRGEYAVIGKTAYAGTKLSDYRLRDDEFTKHFLTTKEYVDSKVVGNTIYSIYSPYIHTSNGTDPISAFTTSGSSDDDGKVINNTEDFTAGAGKRYVLLISGEYNLAVIDSSGNIGTITELDLGQQVYSELENQIYTLIQYPYTDGSTTTIKKILVPETITSNSISFTDQSVTPNITTTDMITFDKLFNDTVYHKLTISPLDLSTTNTYSTTLTIPTTTSPSNYTAYIEYLLKNNFEENAGKIIFLSSYSGIVNTGTNLLLFETHLSKDETISYLECMIDENNTIKLSYDKTAITPSYTNNGSVLTSTSGTYYLIDYYNKHVVKFTLTSTDPTILIDDDNIGTGAPADIYVKDLSLLAELSISKVAATSPNTGYTSYTITVRALSSPEAQHITNWVIETPIILNTYKH